MDPVTPIVNFFQHAADLAFWWRVYREASGAAFFPTMALGGLAAIILLLWRSPKLLWFNGKLAALTLVGLLALTATTVIIVAVMRATQAIQAPSPSAVKTEPVARRRNAHSQTAVDQIMEHTP